LLVVLVETHLLLTTLEEAAVRVQDQMVLEVVVRRVRQERQLQVAAAVVVTVVLQQSTHKLAALQLMVVPEVMEAHLVITVATEQTM
jgi:hypothetical protein